MRTKRSDRIHLLFLVTRGDSIGGAQIHVRDMAKALTRDGFRVTVLTGAAGDMTEQLDQDGISWFLIPKLVRPIKPWQDIKAIIATAQTIRRLKPDLVSTHTAKSGMVGRLAAFLAGVPSIFTAHGWQFADGIPAGQAKAVLFIEKLVAPLCRRVITVSRYDYELALRKKAVSANKMVTIHNGLPWREPPASETAALRSGDIGEGQRVRLLMVARFQEQKDHAALLEALAGIRSFDQNLEWSLELVGDGPGMSAEQARARELYIADRVEFSGQQLDVPERMDRADIYLLISNWEGFPRSIIEAMRAGLPVIASDVGGCNESVRDGQTGFLVDKGDIPVLQERIQSLIVNTALRVQFGEAGRRLYEEQFTFQNMYKKTVELYRQVVNK